MDKKKIVINIMGKSGAGKSVIKKKILEKRPNFHEVVTCTTRPIREGEKNGVDYFFYSEIEMANKIMDNEMIECVVFNDWTYGTSHEGLVEDAVNIGVWNPEGGEYLNQEPGIHCINFLIDALPKVRIIRTLEREENPDIEEIFRRYKADERDFSDIDINYFIVQNDGKKTVDEIADQILFIVDKLVGQG
jgi:guanylate kinase